MLYDLRPVRISGTLVGFSLHLSLCVVATFEYKLKPIHLILPAKFNFRFIRSASSDKRSPRRDFWFERQRNERKIE